jgi:hypothetical protein
MTDEAPSPAPKPKVEPVGWSEMLAAIKGETVNHDFRLGILKRELLDPGLTAAGIASLLRSIEEMDRRAEVFAAAWRVLWCVRTDERLLKRLKQVRAAEQASDDGQQDHVRYD